MADPSVTAGLTVDVTVPGRLRAAFAAERGQVVGVLGPNGAGKSTLVGAVAGLLGDVGRVEVGGEEWSAPGRSPVLVRDRRVGMVWQGQALFPHLTALENVAFGLRSRGMRAAEARPLALSWLDRFGIGDLAGRRPRELSGGQAQRVSIARALVTEPALLLLDEPFAGLDIGVATSLRIELRSHLTAFAGVTLLVTHDPLDAFVLADRLLVLDAGKVVQYGAPADVAARPLTEHVARLAGLNVVVGDAGMVAFRPADVTVSLSEPDGSARLRWSGRVRDLTPHGDALRVRVTTPDLDLVADLTSAAAAELGVVPGREVWLTVKATAATSYTGGK